MVWIALIVASLSAGAAAKAMLGYVRERRRLLVAAKEWYGGLA